MSQHDPLPQNDAIERGHEPDAVNARLIALSGGGLVLLMALVLLLTLGTLQWLETEQPAASVQPSIAPSVSSETGPQVSADQPQKLHELRQDEERQLNSYEWIDQQAGVARIPIGRAMKILAENGIPAATPESEKTDDNATE